ncbi:MAG TPA: energy-coupling factor transporter transmembrane protein EcfT [Firmicutes bacterium]|nr:energy-coupling factor transporter transmembrane protein EcfT [Bacillota bacterium]
MESKRRVGKQEALISLDPRTKIFVLLIFNFIMLSSVTEGIGIYIKPALASLAFLLLLNARRTKTAVIYLILYAIASQTELVLTYFPGMSAIGFLMRFFTQIIARMTPGFMVAYYVITTTKVSEFVASMERLRLSQKMIIPFAVMFRFFPTIADENRSIQDAMRLRSIGFRRGPVAMIEYRLVPLIVSIVKIGDELSAAAVTRGLGGKIKRTNYCKIGFGVWDIVFFLLMTGVFILNLVF